MMKDQVKSLEEMCLNK